MSEISTQKRTITPEQKIKMMEEEKRLWKKDEK